MNADASTVAALLAVDPAGLGGVALRSGAGSVRDEWLSLLRSLLPTGTPLMRAPLNITATALLGGLDLGATLHLGKPVGTKGLLCESDGGLVLLPMAERMSAAAASRFCAVLDTQQVVLARDGIEAINPARVGVVALDEGVSDDERLPSALLERLAFHVALEAAVRAEENEDTLHWSAAEVSSARKLLSSVTIDDAAVNALCNAALALGVDSLRASVFAVRVARVAAALSGAAEVSDEHTAVAARLVLAPRATRIPQPQAEPEQEDQPPEAQAEQEAQPPAKEAPEPPSSEQDKPDDSDESDAPATQGELAEQVLEAAQAAIPAGLLAALRLGNAVRSKTASAGRSGAAQ